MTLKDIVIVSEFFAPNNRIAAVRSTKLAKHFKLAGNYNITVISKELEHNDVIDTILRKDLKYVDKHITISYIGYISKLRNLISKLGIKITSIDELQVEKEKNGDINIINITKLFLWRKSLVFISKCLYALLCGLLLDAINTKNYIHNSEKIIKSRINNCDMIFSTYGPFSSHIIGSQLKKRWPKAFWIADFRDPVVTPVTPPKHSKYFKLISKAIQTADIITGVTDMCIKGFEEKHRGKLYAMCNGFDRDDLQDIGMAPLAKFTLTYAGLLYKGRSDLSVVFKAISELINEKYIDKNYIVINYAGRSEIDFMQQVEKYDLAEAVNVHGFIDRRRSLELQINSSLLLLASWNFNGYTDVITGKFLEYLMINKPIVCAITGNLANSKLKEIITEANNGIVWEEANDKVDYPVLKGYIVEQYERFINNKPPRFEPNMEYIEQYNYENIAQQFIDLIENRCK